MRITRCRATCTSSIVAAASSPPRWRFALPPPPASQPSRPYVVLLTATSRADKLWPEPAWRALIQHFDRAGLATLLPWGSPEEEARVRRLAEAAPGAVVPPWLSLPDAAALLAGTELAIGVDTGFTHLAAALGTPTIGLFFATDPQVHGVACAGLHARDLGQAQRMPESDDVVAVAGELLRAAPRC